MAETREPFVIVGGGLAGAKAAETLREEGFDGRVVLVGEEPSALRAAAAVEGLPARHGRAEKARVHDAGWYAEHDVDLRTGVAGDRPRPGRAPGRRSTRGRSCPTTKLLLATGSVAAGCPSPAPTSTASATCARSPTPTGCWPTLRRGRKRVVIVGAGWIGLEVAAAARTYGNDGDRRRAAADAAARRPRPEMGQVFADLHREHGVDLFTDTGAGVPRRGGRVGRVVTDGTPSCRPTSSSSGWARPQHRPGRGGRAWRSTTASSPTRPADLGDPDVFAAGDVAIAFHPLYGRHVRVEHWANALNGGPAAARSMLGQDVTYDRVPYFFTDQYDLGMEYTGLERPGYDTVVCRAATRTAASSSRSGSRTAGCSPA